MSPSLAAATGVDLITVSYDLAETARAQVEDDDRGRVELYADAGAGDILVGAAAIGPDAEEWMGEVTLAIRARIPLPVLADVVHAFPTYGEAVGTPLRGLAQRSASGTGPARGTAGGAEAGPQTAGAAGGNAGAAGDAAGVGANAEVAVDGARGGAPRAGPRGGGAVEGPARGCGRTGRPAGPDAARAGPRHVCRVRAGTGPGGTTLKEAGRATRGGNRPGNHPAVTYHLRGELMNDISGEFTEDPEVPTEDALEQHQPLPGEDDEAGEAEGFELPDEANEADVAEQHQEVRGDDENEDAYR